MEDVESAINNIPEFSFFNKLDDVNSDNVDITSYLQVCDECKQSSSIDKYIRKIVQNYKDNKNNFNQESDIDYCTYFTYWLYKEKNAYNTNNPHLTLNIWNDCIPCVWEKLERERKFHNKPCNFDNANITYALVKVKKMLADMCIINKNMVLMKDIKSDRDKCVYFNKKMDDNLKFMLIYISTISSDATLKKNYFEINKNCSLKNVRTLFEKIDCPPDINTGCPEQKECDITAPKIENACSTELWTTKTVDPV
ncbi:hypothetical protein PVIIG_06322 [Plasmodium vivax India VII]|uniref:Uncharacterized protein n=1 Tax=Plasmodium vivax India VII TaxID=1077284 RepID=A0A0J9UTJ8_PLAVI|nr:hypothetical protein PVIIG_06322 [Plasmodium vivax India VII]